MRNCTLFRAKSHAVAIKTSCDCVNRNACCVSTFVFYVIIGFELESSKEKKEKKKKIERAIADQLIDLRSLGDESVP